MMQAQSNALDREIAELNNQQQKLQAAESRLATKVEAFRTKKETIKAQYSAADAQVKMSPASARRWQMWGWQFKGQKRRLRI